MIRNFLDARELEHPKPLEEAIKALRELDDSSYFYMIHRKKPIPLINLAEKEEFCLVTFRQREDMWHILITKNRDIPLNELIEKNIS